MLNRQLYNDVARSLQIILFRISHKISKGDCPVVFQWITVDNRKVVSWPIWLGREWTINLLKEGFLVAVDSAGNEIPGIKISTDVIYDESRAFFAEHRGERCNLFEIYNMISKRRETLGIELNGDWPEKIAYDD